MRWNGQSRETVFILGAGATRGAVRHVLINGRRIKAPLNGDFFEIVEAFVKAHRDQGVFRKRFDRLRRVFSDEFPTRGRWPIPMEAAFSLLYVSKDFPEIYARGRGRVRRAGTRTEIEDFLKLTFGILASFENHAPRNNLYSALVSRLEANDTIITLNYDTLLDSALVRSGWDPGKGYGVVGGNSKIEWKMPRPEMSDSLDGVRLLKLHGSLNWLVRGTYGDVRHVFDAKPSKIVISDGPRTNEYHGFIRQIIPPIYGKFFNHPHWQQLWKKAYDSLTSAKVIVVIGCSLVDTDFHLTGMLSRAVAQRKHNGDNFVASILVDRVRVRRKWLRVLRGCVSNKLAYRSFAEFGRNVLEV